MRGITRPGPIAAVVAVVTALGACGADTGRSGGAPAGEKTVLRLANANDGPEELQIFIDQVDKLSDGRLEIRSVDRWRDGETAYESGLAEDVRSGKADLGWVGSRALPGLGVPSFAPLHAPFLLDSYELQEKALRGAGVERMLADLQTIGLKGIAVLPGPLRYLQLDRGPAPGAPLAGARIGYVASALQREALLALGAEPVEMPAGGPISGLDGVESYAAAIHGNGYVRDAPHTVADAPLWPRVFVLFAGAHAWRRLPAADRDLLRKAAGRARARTAAAVAERERHGVAGMCEAGVRLLETGPAGRARMRAAVEPLIRRLRRDRATRQAMAEIESLRGPGGPHGLRCPGGDGAQRPALSGVFETTIRKSEAGSEVLADEWAEAGADVARLRLELDDGRAVITEDFPGGPVTGFDESYAVFKDVIEFGGIGGPPITARWKLDGRRLRFTEVDGEPGDRFVWGRTWTRTR